MLEQVKSAGTKMTLVYGLRVNGGYATKIANCRESREVNFTSSKYDVTRQTSTRHLMHRRRRRLPRRSSWKKKHDIGEKEQENENDTGVMRNRDARAGILIYTTSAFLNNEDASIRGARNKIVASLVNSPSR